MIEMIHELCSAQEKIAEIHSTIYKEIHPRINQALTGLDELLASQQMDMDDDTHQTYLMACKRAHKLEESLKLQGSAFPLKKRKRTTSLQVMTVTTTLFPSWKKRQKP